MKTYSLFDAPLRVSGVPFFEENRRLVRLPEQIMEQLPNLAQLGRRCAGGRVAFCTDAEYFTVKLRLKTLSLDIGMSIYAGQSVQVMVGPRENARHIGLVCPPDYETLEAEKTFRKEPGMELVTLYFPRNEILENIWVTVEDTAAVTAPTPYRYEKPVVFYGSSITEGGCANCSTNAYNAILSRWLDFDYINLGFSGCCLAEEIMADYINTLDMIIFVYDYDHNAPDPDHLRRTHKPFFDKIRQRHPDLPILMMTRPAAVYEGEILRRREIVKATYDAAVAAGDKKVWFIDGESFYGPRDRHLCSFDEVHPNDLGFYRMATVIRPVLQEILEGL